MSRNLPFAAKIEHSAAMPVLAAHVLANIVDSALFHGPFECDCYEGGIHRRRHVATISGNPSEVASRLLELTLDGSLIVELRANAERFTLRSEGVARGLWPVRFYVAGPQRTWWGCARYREFNFFYDTRQKPMATLPAAWKENRRILFEELEQLVGGFDMSILGQCYSGDLTDDGLVYFRRRKILSDELRRLGMDVDDSELQAAIDSPAGPWTVQRLGPGEAVIHDDFPLGSLASFARACCRV